MIRLKSVTGSGFRSFANSFSIADLPDCGLISLAGKSGSGKSSFVQSVSYVLGTMSESAKEQACWLPNALPMKVTLEVAQGDELTTIVRGESGAHMDNQRGRAEGAKALNAALPEFFGIDMDTLTLVTYRAQRQLGTFLAKSDADKKSTLWTLLGISQYEGALEKLKTDQLASERDLKQLKSRPVEAPGERPELKPDFFAIGDFKWKFETDRASFVNFLKEQEESARTPQPEEGLNLEFLQSEWTRIASAGAVQVATLHSEYKTAQENGTPEVIESRQAVAAAAQAHVVARKNLSEAANHLMRAKSVWEAIEREGGEIIKREAQLKEEMVKLQDRLAAHEKGVCPTCTQPWQNSRELQNIHAAIEKNQAQLGSIGKQQSDLVERVPRAKQILAETEEKHGSLAAIDKQAVEAYTAIQAQGGEIERRERERQKNLWSDVYGPKIAEVEAALTVQKADFNARIASATSIRQEWMNQGQAVKAAIREAEQSYSLAQQGWLHSKQLIDVWERQNKNFDDYNTQLAVAEQKAVLLTDARDVMQGFLDRVVQDVLAEINISADKLMAAVPNVAHMGLVLGLREKRGRAEIAAEISVDGNIVSYTQLSGGQKSVVELLTDLAIWEVVAKYRGGNMPGWLVLDEPFDGMGPEDIDSCLDILEKYAQSRLIVVIHHATEFKKRFQRTYDFVRNVSGSTIESSAAN